MMKKYIFNPINIFVIIMVAMLGFTSQCYAENEIDSAMNAVDVVDIGELAGDEVVVEDDGMATDEMEAEALLPEVYFKAINPGYKIDDTQNVGEMIEICRLNSDAPISLAGATVGYTNSSGNYSLLLGFPSNSWLAGECILLRLASSPNSELASMNYVKTLAFKGGLTLLFDDEVVDEVCWSGKDGCSKAFESAKPTTLVRNLITGEFEHIESYEPVFDETSFYLQPEEDEESGGEIDDKADGEEGGGEGNEEGGEEEGDEVEYEDEEPSGESGDESKDKNLEEVAIGPEYEDYCKHLKFSEILSYYEESATEQFIELRNDSDEAVVLKGCYVRYKSHSYELNGEVEAGGYYAYRLVDFRLTKNPVKMNTIELIDEKGDVVDVLEYYNGQKKGTSYALIESDDEKEWAITYNVTPGAENIYQQFRTCESGKVINELTGNCVKETIEIEKVCPEGYYLNESTGRCRKEEVAIERICKEGYYLNESTGRCKKVVVETEKICKDGYYLNESTGRCRKVEVETEKICKDGYYLNESTGRCRKIVTETVKTCDEGYYLNILTGRCNKIKEETVKTCAEGYYLNEETGRCRKIKENDGSDYAIKPKEYEEKTSFVALYAIIGIVGIAILYVVFQFRKEIWKLIRKVFH